MCFSWTDCVWSLVIIGDWQKLTLSLSGILSANVDAADILNDIAWHSALHCHNICDRLRLIPSNHKSWLAKLILVISYQVLFWFWHLHCYNLCLIPCNLLMKIGQQNSSRRALCHSPTHWFMVSQNTNVFADYLKMVHIFIILIHHQVNQRFIQTRPTPNFINMSKDQYDPRYAMTFNNLKQLCWLILSINNNLLVLSKLAHLW